MPASLLGKAGSLNLKISYKLLLSLFKLLPLIQFTFNEMLSHFLPTSPMSNSNNICYTMLLQSFKEQLIDHLSKYCNIYIFKCDLNSHHKIAIYTLNRFPSVGIIL